MFQNCTSISRVTIPPSVTEIGAACFSGCTSINEILIPNSVKVIGELAFSGCESLGWSNYLIQLINFCFRHLHRAKR